MDTTPAARPIPLFLTALVAVFAALAALAASSGHDALAHEATAPTTAHATAAMAGKEVVLRQNMRRLWEDHITWTRLAIISLTTGAPDTEATVTRLLRNQAAIGNAVKPFYGKAAADEVTRQLRRHILVAADLIAAAKAGDENGLADAQARWRQNADDIAGVLNSVNPRHWKLARLKRELRRHLALTTEEAVARLQGNWRADVAAYDKIHDHALHFADLLSSGLVKQFPQRYGR